MNLASARAFIQSITPEKKRVRPQLALPIQFRTDWAALSAECQSANKTPNHYYSRQCRKDHHNRVGSKLEKQGILLKLTID